MMKVRVRLLLVSPWYNKGSRMKKRCLFFVLVLLDLVRKHSSERRRLLHASSSSSTDPFPLASTPSSLSSLPFHPPHPNFLEDSQILRKPEKEHRVGLEVVLLRW